MPGSAARARTQTEIAATVPAQEEERPLRVRPAIVRYELGGHYCKRHGADVNNTHDEAIYYLRRWLWIARDKANDLLEGQLSEALLKAETWLIHLEQELDQAREDVAEPE